MSMKIVGKSVQRLDAVAKVTGRARYSEDYFERDMLVGKVLRSPHAHARVKRMDASRARALPGVEAVITPADLPKVKFPTAGHPWSLDPAHRDVADRLILTDKARFVGDAVAAVVAVDALTAEKALHLIEVEYEVLPFVLTAEDALKDGAPVLHDGAARTTSSAASAPSTGTSTPPWPPRTGCSRAASRPASSSTATWRPRPPSPIVDSHGRIVINTSTQIPHIVRRIVAQALGLRWGRVQVIKPYIGGGFGAKQDVVIEPLVAAMTLAVHGRPVRCTFTREEVFIDSRTRHAMKIDLRIAASKDGMLQGIEVTGAEQHRRLRLPRPFHRHVRRAPSSGRCTLPQLPVRARRPSTPTCRWPGPCAATGSPQMFFALESHLEDIARALQLDPIEFRRRTSSAVGYTGPPHRERGALLRHPRVHRARAWS